MKTTGVLIKIELPAKEIVLFNTLYEAGVFGIRNGSATLHFDSEGVLTQIESKIISFKKGKDIHTPFKEENML